MISVKRLSAILAMAVFVILARLPLAADWPTFGGNPQRDSWNREASALTPGNVARLRLEWQLKLDAPPKELNSLSIPLIRSHVKIPSGFTDVIILAGARDQAFAIDANAHRVLWTREFPTDKPTLEKGEWLCPYAQNSTPVLVGNTAYFLASDGRLTGIDIPTGTFEYPQFSWVHRWSKTWSLNFVGDKLFTTASESCNGVISGVHSIDLTGFRHSTASFIAAPRAGGGVWGLGGVSAGFDGSLFAATGDGPVDPNTARFSDSVVKLSPNDLKLVDYYLAPNHEWINRRDLDMGSITPVVFKFHGHELVAGAGKEGVIFLLDAAKPGGADHSTPLFRSPMYSNENAELWGHGFWGALSTCEDETGTRWLFASSWGPPVEKGRLFPLKNGDSPNGSVMAFKVEDVHGSPVLTPVWKSRDMLTPSPVVIHQGMVFVLSSGELGLQFNANGSMMTTKQRIALIPGKTVLYALDLKTGKELFSSGDAIRDFTHFSAPVVSQGKVYVVTHDATLYAFAVDDKPPASGITSKTK
jgi:outer membrane protein assembly factor BamB